MKKTKAQKKQLKEFNANKSEYEIEEENNVRVFSDIIKQIRPEIFVLMDLLEKTRVNHLVIFQVIRHLHNLSMGSKYGKVTIEVQDGVVAFVRGEEATKMNESVILPRPEETLKKALQK